MKKKWIILIVSILVIVLSGGYLIVDHQKQTTESNTTLVTVYDIYEDNTLKWQYYSKLDTLTKEETYSVDEMNNYLMSEGYDELLVNDFTIGMEDVENVRYGLINMKTFDYDNYDVQVRLIAGLDYTNSETPVKITSVIDPYAYVGEGEDSVFVGQIDCRLQESNHFYYVIAGDIYPSGDVVWGRGQKLTKQGTLRSVGSFVDPKDSGQSFLNISEEQEYYSSKMEP